MEPEEQGKAFHGRRLIGFGASCTYLLKTGGICPGPCRLEGWSVSRAGRWPRAPMAAARRPASRAPARRLAAGVTRGMWTTRHLASRLDGRRCGLRPAVEAEPLPLSGSIWMTRLRTSQDSGRWVAASQRHRPWGRPLRRRLDEQPLRRRQVGQQPLRLVTVAAGPRRVWCDGGPWIACILPEQHRPWIPNILPCADTCPTPVLTDSVDVCRNRRGFHVPRRAC